MVARLLRSSLGLLYLFLRPFVLLVLVLLLFSSSSSFWSLWVEEPTLYLLPQ